MKNVTLTLILFLTAVYAHSQPGTLTGIQVSQRTDGSGFVDIYFNLSGSASAYNISLEASFDAGSSYQAVPAEHLSGDVISISPGNNKHIVWDGMASFPNAFSSQAQIKILASSSENSYFDTKIYVSGDGANLVKHDEFFNVLASTSVSEVGYVFVQNNKVFHCSDEQVNIYDISLNSLTSLPLGEVRKVSYGDSYYFFYSRDSYFITDDYFNITNDFSSGSNARAGVMNSNNEIFVINGTTLSKFDISGNQLAQASLSNTTWSGIEIDATSTHVSVAGRGFSSHNNYHLFTADDLDPIHESSVGNNRDAAGVSFVDNQIHFWGGMSHGSSGVYLFKFDGEGNIIEQYIDIGSNRGRSVKASTNNMVGISTRDDTKVILFDHELNYLRDLSTDEEPRFDIYPNKRSYTKD